MTCASYANMTQDVASVGDENANNNIQTSHSVKAKNPTPCRTAMTPRQRNSICSDPDKIVKEARFQKEVEPFGRRTRSTVDMGYMEPHEGRDNFSKALRKGFYKPAPTITDKRETPTIIVDEEVSVQSCQVSVQSPRVSLQSPRMRPMTPTRKDSCGTPSTADFGYVSPTEGDQFARSLRPSTPERSKTWKPTSTVPSAPNLSPRRERISSTSTTGQTPEARNASVEARRRPATPEKRNRPATTKQRPATPERKPAAATEASEKVSVQLDAPAPTGREVEAMKKHLQRQGAANQGMQHSDSAAPDLLRATSPTRNVTARIFDAREKVALAKHLERASASSQQKLKTQRAPLTAR